MEVGEEVERFLDYCRGKGLQPSTLNRSYGMALRRILLPFCERQGIKHMVELTPEKLSVFAAELHGRQLSKWSIGAYIRSVNRFLTWYGIRDPAAKAPRPRTRKIHRDVLTVKEMRELEDAATTVRDQLIIRILADTGCRLGELTALRVGDVVQRGREWYLLVHGKTGERKVPIDEDLHRRLRAFILHGRQEQANDRLFISSHRHPVSGRHEPLKEDGVYQVVKDVVERTKWKRRVYPHLLRHSWITHMEARRVDPAIIAEVAGVSIEVIVKNYSHLSDRDRHQAIMRALTEG